MRYGVLRLEIADNVEKEFLFATGLGLQTAIEEVGAVVVIPDESFQHGITHALG
jgi:hypothetical protein